MTTAGKVFAECSTLTVHAIARTYAGVAISGGYKFPDGSILKIDALGNVGYCRSDKA